MPIRHHLCLAVLSFVALAQSLQSLAADSAVIPKDATSATQPNLPTATVSTTKVAPTNTANQNTTPDSSDRATDPSVGATPTQDKVGSTTPEYKRLNRAGLSAAGSQRMDWLTGKNRFDWPTEYNAKKTLGLPDWLNASLEFRARYESMDTPWAKGQTGSQYQIPLQTVLWMEANYQALRVGFEFWDARQYGTKEGQTLNNTMVDSADFPQIYAALSTLNLFDTGLGAEVKGGRMTLDLGSRRLVARNNFRNTTNSFTGILFRLRDPDSAWQVQVFGNQPVQRLPDQATDLLHNDYAWDQEQKNTVFAGIFAEAFKLPWSTSGELYLYYLGENPSSSNNRRLFTPGFRWFKQPKKGGFDFEGESAAQTGNRYDNIYDAKNKSTKMDVSVEAFMEHIQFGYTFDLPWDPRLVLQYDYVTGGATSGTSKSFDTLYGARRWEYGPTGILGLFARNNINSPGTRVFIVPHRNVTAFTAYRAWWMANSTASWSPANLIDSSGNSGDFLGHTVELTARWDPHENLGIEGGWTYFIKGTFARNAPHAPSNHDNVNYVYVQTELRF
jgi:hypothetical protein